MNIFEKVRKIGKFKLVLLVFLAAMVVLGLVVRKNQAILQPSADLAESDWIELSRDEFVGLLPKQQFKYLDGLAKKNGLENAWRLVIDSYQDAKVSNGPAHDLAHFMGGLIYDKAGFGGLSICTPVFAFGCYHGFLDNAFLNDTQNLPAAEEACNKLGVVNSGPVASCIHGIGHGLASFYQVKNLEGALRECDRLRNGQQFCYDGVFMEFERSASPNFYNLFRPLYPCDQLPPIYASSCGRNQPQVMRERFKFDYNRVVGVCEQSIDGNFQQACFDSLGFMTVSMSGANPTQIIWQCSQPQAANFRSRCLRAAAGELVFQNMPGWQVSSPQICDALDGERKEDCYINFQALAKDYGR